MFSEENYVPPTPPLSLNNPPIGSVERGRQGHQNQINSFNYPNDTVHKIWSESIIWFQR